MKKLFNVLAVIFLLLLVIVILIIQPVDYTPYFQADYYITTKSRLDTLVSQTRSTFGAVEVGMGKRSITPTINADADDPLTGKFIQIPLAGYGGRKGAPATGVHDSLFVKAIAVRVGDKTMVFIGSDLLIMPPEVSKKSDEIVTREKGLTRESLFYSASHTHSSVGAWSEGVIGELFGGQYNPHVIDWLAAQVSGAILDAIADLRPGSIGISNFHAKDFVRNRLVKEDGRVNTDFMLIKATQSSGSTAVIGSFDAHATTLGEWNLETSADFPGYWQRKLEAEGFDLAVYIAGSVGSHTNNGQGERFDKSKYIGEALADSVLKHLPEIALKDSIRMASITLEVDMPEFQFRISDGYRLRPYVANSLFPEVGTVFLQTAMLDSLIWSTTPSDFSGETAIDYKNAMNKRGFRAMVSSFNGAYTGYIIPCKYYHFNSYESRMMNWFGPSYNPFINYMLGEMMDKVSSMP
ncbi:MAG: neutral/alkaline non-lysosomal ceramidase N-terminal domain-containing protein [Cyclobacteriaceae bacterium]|nr:neutral/alkaline non-lysosomal ceramidase N-terminal domain-containing protein [Cyclobacteriaceae bacterium]